MEILVGIRHGMNEAKQQCAEGDCSSKVWRSSGAQRVVRPAHGAFCHCRKAKELRNAADCQPTTRPEHQQPARAVSPDS